MIRVPLHTAERMRKISAVRAALLQENGQEPTPAEIANRCGLPEQKVRQLQKLIPEVCSLDAPTGDGEDGSLAVLIADLETPQPYEELVRTELAQTMDALMAMLTERQQQVLRMHFGMDDGICHSLEEIGGVLEVSKERARQIKQQAMDKLQKLGASMGLEDFLE